MNSYIYLSSFYDDETYLLDVSSGYVSLVKDGQKHHCNGFYAKEPSITRKFLGFIYKKEYIDFAIYSLDGKIYFLCGQNIYHIDGNDFLVKRKWAFMFLVKITIQFSNVNIQILQHDKLTDTFFMDDFFYYLRYTARIKFIHFCDIWDSKNND